MEIANRKHWIHKLDDFEEDNLINIHEKRNLEIFEDMENKNNSNIKIKTITDENELLKKQLEELKEQLKLFQNKPIEVVIEEPVIVIEEKPVIIEDGPRFSSQKEMTKHYEKLEKEDKKKKKVIKKSNINHYESIADFF